MMEMMPIQQQTGWALGLVTKVQTWAITDQTTVVIKPFCAKHILIYLLIFIYILQLQLDAWSCCKSAGLDDRR